MTFTSIAIPDEHQLTLQLRLASAQNFAHHRVRIILLIIGILTLYFTSANPLHFGLVLLMICRLVLELHCRIAPLVKIGKLLGLYALFISSDHSLSLFIAIFYSSFVAYGISLFGVGLDEGQIDELYEWMNQVSMPRNRKIDSSW